jgi:RNA polymerase sigma-70 factor (ECF subfamily)
MVPLKSKDLDTYSNLYDTYAPALYSVIIKLVPNAHIANSVLEKSFLKIWLEWNGFDASKGKLFSWMLRITIQECKVVVGFSKNAFHHLFLKKNM